MPRFLAALLHALATAVGWLPWRWLDRIANRTAWMWRRLDARESRVARRNLELAFPELDDTARAALHAAVLWTTAHQALETLRLWTRPRAANLALVRETHGAELFDQALASPRGVIIAAPHYGNWELLNQWLADRTPLAILYRAPESAIGEAFLRRVRADDDGRVTQVRADGGAVRRLLQLLRGGGVVGILPDQQPKAGDGEFAPFFGVQALTMSLLSRLAARTDAIVLFAWCERIGEDPVTHAPMFAVHVQPAPIEVASDNPAIGVRALNATVESIARRQPQSYQWTYKRYTLRPPGSGEPNPYYHPDRH